MRTPRSNTVILTIAVIFFVFALFSTIFVTTLWVRSSTTKSCVYKGETYKSGEGFKDDCNSCSCIDGEVACTLIACGEYDLPVDISGDEPTQQCLYEGQLFNDGEGFESSDGCNSCSCEDGQVSCTAKECSD